MERLRISVGNGLEELQHLARDRWPFYILVLAVLIPYYAKEPAPADIISALAIVGMAIITVRRGLWHEFKWTEWFLIAYSLLIFVQLIVLHGQSSAPFTFTTLYLVGVYFVFYLAKPKPQDIKWFMAAYLFAAILTSALMVGELIGRYSLNWTWLQLYFDRPDAWFKDANVAGPALLPIVALCLYRYIQSGKIGWFIITLFTALGVLLSFSRGAYLGLLGVVFLTLIWQAATVYSRHLHWQPFASRGLVFILGILVLWSGMNLYAPFNLLTNERFGSLIHRYDLQGRAVSWESGVAGFLSHPLGTGSGSYEHDSAKFQENLLKKREQSTSSAAIKQGSHPTPTRLALQATDAAQLQSNDQILVTPSAHNTFLRVLKENGLVGFGLLVAFWLWLLIQSLRYAARALRSPEQPIERYFIPVLISYMVLLPMGSFIDTLHWRHLWYITGLLAVILWHITYGQAKAPQQVQN